LLLVCFLSLVSLLHSVLVRVDVGYLAIYPTSSWLRPGDTLEFFDTSNSSHYIVSITQNFSGVDPTGPFSNIGGGPLGYSYKVNVTDSHAVQGFLWSDLLNPATSAFGVVYVARSNDVFIEWGVFATHPPAASGYALKNYTDNPTTSFTIAQGQRVVWNSTLEDLLNHPVLFTDNNWHATIGCPFNHALVSNRNFHYFAWEYDFVGAFHYICAVHPSMFGTITVTSDGTLAAASSDPAVDLNSHVSPYGCFNRSNGG